MAVVLIGEIVNSCDTVTGFNVGNISGDDDFVEGTGAIGLKVAASYAEIYTTSLGATAPYDFSTSGGEAGYHYILWFNTKLAIASTGGLRCIMGNGTDRGEWDVDPTGFYKGGFLTRVIDPSRDFDRINAGTWTTNGNPAQLSNITTMGGGVETVPTIMGNFNSVQLDQMTIGLGLVVSGGTVGSPNTFEEVRAYDEDTNFFGWWSSANGTIIGKGKLFIGDNGGSTVFSDVSTSVAFADELVGEDFYEININGTNTTCDFELMNFSAARPNSVRWGLTVEDNVSAFTMTNCVISGSRIIKLNDSSNVVGSTIINGLQLIQSGGTLDGISVLNNSTGSTAYITSDSPELISNSTFTFNSGHAIELTSAVSSEFTFSNNTFIGYGASGSTDAAIYNNSGKAVIINVTDGGSTPTIRNGAGASTTVNNAVVLSLSNLVDDTEVRIYTSGTITEVAGQESVTGGTFSYAYNYAASTFVDIVIFKESYLFNEPDGRIKNFELGNTNTTIPINQRFDRNYNNP